MPNRLRYGSTSPLKSRPAAALALVALMGGSLVASRADAHSPSVAQAPPRISPPRPATFRPSGIERSLPSPATAAEPTPKVVEPTVEQLLAKGAELESQQRWADAMSHYDDATRQHPKSMQLEQRFDFARLHYSLERRYADDTFLKSLTTLTGDQASRLYRELLRKIESHYVVTPPWNSIAQRGALSLRIALADEAFRRRHRVRGGDRQLQQYAAEARAAASRRGALRSRADVVALQAELTRLAAYRFGISPTAATMEFASSAVGGLDHYSGFLTPGQLRDVYSQIEGNFVGLGVELKADDGALLIVRVIPRSPAEQAGLRADDRITAVDGQQTAELSTDQAAGLLTGEAGTSVRIVVTSPATQVARPVNGSVPPSTRGWTRELTVRREHVDVPALEEVKIIDPEYGVAYVRVPVFQKTTSRDLESTLWDLHRQGMRSLVVDLRGNPGGLLTSSVELADKFVAKGNIVSTRGRSEGEDFDYRAHRAGTWRVPLVVLIDGDSASASEIFAAAISDNGRGTIVGDRSYGKGSVQGIFPLGYGGAGVRLTTAKFYSPNGDPISKVGVSPDIVVRHAKPVADGRHEVGFRGVAGAGDDRALSRAIEAARQQVALR